MDEAEALKDDLDDYANGITGPGVCTDGLLSGPARRRAFSSRNLLSIDRVVSRSPPPPAIQTQWSLNKRSWLSVFADNAKMPVRRAPIPASAANNGAVTMEVDSDSVTAIELCMCAGDGALVRFDYVNPGSTAIYDQCGVCGGDGSSCRYASIDSVRVHTRIGTSPLAIRVHDEDDNDAYEICYYHARQHSDQPEFSGHAVRISFEPHEPCSLTRNGSCDSLDSWAVGGPRQWCDNFIQGPSETTTNGWQFQALGSTDPLSCMGDALFTCPEGDGSAGYRVCRNFTLSQMLRCQLRDGATSALRTAMTPDHRIEYSGQLFATEVEPVECDDPHLCERVIHQATRRMLVKTSTYGAMQADFDSLNMVLDARVTGVTCSGDDEVRVHFSTTTTAPWARSVYLDTPLVVDSQTAVITAAGVEDPVQDARQTNPCMETSVASARCTQMWTARLSHSHATLRMAAAAHTDESSTAHGPVVLQLDAAVPCDSLETEKTGVRRNERRLADGSMVLYHDKKRTKAYVSDLVHSSGNTFTDGSRLYGTVQATLPSDETFSGSHKLVLDAMHVCYPYDGTAAFIPYDVKHPLATGCMSPGQWVVSTYYRRGSKTSDGNAVGLQFAVHGDQFEFEFSAHTVTTSAPLYIDARWHIEWSTSPSAEEFVRSRLSQHRALALAAGRDPEDWDEKTSVYHKVLTPGEMESTRKLPKAHRAHMRNGLMLRATLNTGLTLTELNKATYNRSVLIDDLPRDTSRRYGAYNDDVWYSGGYGYFQTECESGEMFVDQAMDPTHSSCKPCPHGQCKDGNHSDFHFPCTWPCFSSCWPHFDCDDDDHHNHFWWLWLIPLALFLLFWLFWWLWDYPFGNSTAVSTTTVTSGGITSTRVTFLPAR